MQDKVTLDIEIAPSGETKVHVRGMKGKKCMDIVDLFKGFLGEVKDVKRTSEYYEPERESEIKTRY